MTYSVFVMLLFFIFQAHRLLIAQLANRKVADAVGDGIRLALTKWSFADSSDASLVASRQTALKSLGTPGAVDAYFDEPPKQSCSRAFIEKHLFPLGPSKPNTNTDDIWPHLPEDAVIFASKYFKHSYARSFETRLTTISLILFTAGTVGFVVRLLAGFIWS